MTKAQAISLLLFGALVLRGSEIDYIGRYEYQGGSTVDLIVGKGLFAVLDEAKYQLTPAGADTFLNGAGQPVRFRRVGSKITGFAEGGHFYRRLATTPSNEAEQLAKPSLDGSVHPYHVPLDRRDGIPVGDIGQSDLGHNVASRITEGVLNETWADVHSVLLFQHGKLLFEEYFYGYDADRPHQLRSATKSVVGTLAGIAIDKGYLRTVDEPVLRHMAYRRYEHPDERKAAITLRDLLTMRSGLACDDHDPRSPGNETIIDEKPDWVKATLDLPIISQPGSKGFYCSGNVAIVGRLIENTTQTYLPDFAQEHLFGPLGISKSQYTWNYNLTNVNREFAQIHLRPRDMLKLGILMKDDGLWHGKRIIPAPYVQEALSRQSDVDESGYGYFWWHPYLNVSVEGKQKQVYLAAAQGNGGQKIFIVPRFDFVAVFTAGSYNAGGSAPNKIMTQVVLPQLLAMH